MHQLRTFAVQQIRTAVTTLRADVGLGEMGRLTRDIERTLSGHTAVAIHAEWQAMRERMRDAIASFDEGMQMLKWCRAAERLSEPPPIPDKFKAKINEGAQVSD